MILMEAPAPLEPDLCRFACLRSLRWSDEDNQGVVNNAIYLTLLEESRHAYFTALGLLRDNRFPFLLAQTNLSFVKPMRGGQEVRILVRTVQLGTTSFEQVYEIRCAQTGACHARAQARLVCYDSASGEKRPMAEDFRAALARFEGLAPA